MPLSLAQLQAAPYSQRWLLWWACAVASGAALCALRRRVPPGAWRLAVALPLLLLNSRLPFLFDEAAEQNTNVACFIITCCLASLKVGGRCCRADVGPAGGPTVRSGQQQRRQSRRDCGVW